ncbi:hypothetical protein LG293_16605 (plasmid) [Citricoccus nitrophenolicus]
MSSTAPRVEVHGDGPQDIDITLTRTGYMRHSRTENGWTRQHADARIRLLGGDLRGDNDAVEACVFLPDEVTDTDGDSCLAAAVEIQHVRFTSISGPAIRLEGVLAAAEMYPAEAYEQLAAGADPAEALGTDDGHYVRYLPPTSVLFSNLIGSRVELVAAPAGT